MSRCAACAPAAAAETLIAQVQVMTGGPAVTHSRRSEPRHPLPLRPADRARARRWCGCARAARAHAGARLLARASRRRSTSSTGSRTRSRTGSRASCSRRRRASCAIEVDLVAEMSVINPFDFFLEPQRRELPVPATTPAQLHELEPYLAKMPADAALQGLPRRRSRARRSRPIDFLVDAQPAARAGRRATSSAWSRACRRRRRRSQLASGSCRDSGWLLVQLLRHLGIAARFVSGYLIQLKPDVKSLDGPSGTGADFTDLHAWCEAYLPGAGWVGLDPTSGLLAGEGHIPLACTPEPSQRRADHRRAPRSARSSSAHDDAHRARAARRRASPSPTPRRSGATIDALGQRVDADLEARDVRLTMGGEPTFVSIDDRDGAEWNTEAMGPNKRKLGLTLLSKLKQRYAQNGLLHLGQGKWYPGEQLPRWSLSCFWRKDGEPVWNDPALFADEGTDLRRDRAQAALFLRTLAARLGLDAKYVFPPTRTPGTTCGASASCPRTSIRSTRASTTRSSARGCASCFTRAWTRSPVMSLPLQRENNALANGTLVPARRALLPGPRRFAARPAPAARLAALGRGRRPAGDSRAGSVPELQPLLPRREKLSFRTRKPRRQRHRTAPRPCSNRPPGSRAPRSAPSRGTACSTSSCRRLKRSRTTSQLVAAVEATAAELGMPRACSKATSRRAIRASRRCASRPTPACWKSTSSR